MRTFAALILLFSSTAFACPDLTGTFTCTYPNGDSEVVTMSQADKAGVTVYNYNGSEIPADNQVYPMPDDEQLRSATFRAWCENDSLKGNIVGQYWYGGTEFGDLDMSLELSLEGNNIRSATTGQLKAKDGTIYPVDGVNVCIRN